MRCLRVVIRIVSLAIAFYPLPIFGLRSRWAVCLDGWLLLAARFFIANDFLAKIARMALPSKPWLSLPLFLQKSPVFIDAVAYYLGSLSA